MRESVLCSICSIVVAGVPAHTLNMKPHTGAQKEHLGGRYLCTCALLSPNADSNTQGGLYTDLGWQHLEIKLAAA